MKIKSVLALAVCLMAPLIHPVAASANSAYPERPVRLVVPFPPGSTTDAMARYLAEQAAPILGQSLVVANKAGAQGAIAASEVARATADGYTLLVGTNSTQAANLYLSDSLPYDPRKDFAAITQFTVNPLVLVVRADLPVNDLSEFLEYARERPGELNYGVGNTGSLVSAQLLNRMAELEAVAVNYPGSPQAITDLLGGRLHYMVTDVSVVRSHVEAGTLKALGVTTVQPVPALPGVPTIAEAGLKEYEFSSAWGGLFAPAGTSSEILEKLNKAFVTALNSPQSKAFFDKQGQIVAPRTVPDFDRYVQEEHTTWKALIEQADIGK